MREEAAAKGHQALAEAAAKDHCLQTIRRMPLSKLWWNLNPRVGKYRMRGSVKPQQRDTAQTLVEAEAKGKRLQETRQHDPRHASAGWT